MPASSSSLPGGSPDDDFRSPSSSEPVVPRSSSFFASLIANQSFPFSSGNPRVELTRGIVHLYRHDAGSTSSADLPVGRKAMLCVDGVPNHMTYRDFCQFCGSFIDHILEMRIVRIDGREDRYSILLKFDSQESADHFYKHLHGRNFSSLEEVACCVLFTVGVQFTHTIEHVQAPTVPGSSSTEQATCAVCLEKLDQDMCGILTTICNHSFHISCISKWTDSSCPVCRHCQQQPEKSICFVCQTSDNLWICVICGFVGCGRYKEGHAITHWKETHHGYSLELETQRVWDYVGDNYVHRLIQSKAGGDAQLVELNAYCSHANDSCGSCDCVNVELGISEALLNSKVDAIANEYTELLSAQLEDQKVYYESLLLNIKDETEREISRAVEAAIKQKLHKKQAKLDRCVKEKEILDALNESLLANQEILAAKMAEIKESEKKAIQVNAAKMRDLEEQLGKLMMQLEAGQENKADSGAAAPSSSTEGTVKTGKGQIGFY